LHALLKLSEWDFSIVYKTLQSTTLSVETNTKQNRVKHTVPRGMTFSARLQKTYPECFAYQLHIKKTKEKKRTYKSFTCCPEKLVGSARKWPHQIHQPTAISTSTHSRPFIPTLAAFRLKSGQCGGAMGLAQTFTHSNSRLINAIANGTCHLCLGERASRYLGWQVPGVTYKSACDGYVSNN
jgi:hypothetical protein